MLGLESRVLSKAVGELSFLALLNGIFFIPIVPHSVYEAHLFFAASVSWYALGSKLIIYINLYS